MVPLCREHSKSLRNIMKGFSQLPYVVGTSGSHYREGNGYIERLGVVPEETEVRYWTGIGTQPYLSQKPSMSLAYPPPSLRNEILHS